MEVILTYEHSPRSNVSVVSKFINTRVIWILSGKKFNILMGPSVISSLRDSGFLKKRRCCKNYIRHYTQFLTNISHIIYNDVPRRDHKKKLKLQTWNVYLKKSCIIKYRKFVCRSVQLNDNIILILTCTCLDL